jgi:hypothetical protein
VIRLGDESKKFGLVVVPVYDKVGISTSRSVQAVVDTIFNKGEAAVSVVATDRLWGLTSPSKVVKLTLLFHPAS